MAKIAAQMWSENHAASILHYFREMGSSHLVDDTCGLHSVKLEQKTLQGYLEMAFTAGESAEFERLDRRAKQGDARAQAIKAELAQPAAPQEGQQAKPQSKVGQYISCQTCHKPAGDQQTKESGTCQDCKARIIREGRQREANRANLRAHLAANS